MKRQDKRGKIFMNKKESKDFKESNHGLFYMFVGRLIS
jgi:hypothetical protein